jgi:hypothetical protein
MERVPGLRAVGTITNSTKSPPVFATQPLQPDLVLGTNTWIAVCMKLSEPGTPMATTSAIAALFLKLSFLKQLGR